MEPRCSDVLLIRKAFQDALSETAGVTFAGTYVDVLYVNESGFETVVRVNAEDANTVLAAIVGASRASIRYSVVHESSFLPSLVPDDLGDA